MRRQLLTFSLLILIQSLVYSQNTRFTISDNGDFFQNGKRIGKVVKTANSNILTSTLPEFTIYDVNGVARFLFEKNEGKFIFLDDNRSFLPRKVDAYPKQVAQFFASDSILTSKGYNQAYRSAFIKKYDGYNFSEEKERDFNAPLRYIESNILQGETLIGYYDYQAKDNTKDVLVAVMNINKKIVAYISILGNSGLTDVTIQDQHQQTVKVFKQQLNSAFLYRMGIEWVMQNGLLGKERTETKTQSQTSEPVTKQNEPIRFLEVTNSEATTGNFGPAQSSNPISDMVKAREDLTVVATLNSSGDALSISTESVKGRHSIHSKVIDLSTGRVETNDSSIINFVRNLTVRIDASMSKGGEYSQKICIKANEKDPVNCFNKPPEGYIYTSVLSEKYLLGINTKTAHLETFMFHSSGDETKVKFRLEIYRARSSEDGRKIFGLYTYQTDLWIEQQRLSQRLGELNKNVPSDRNSKEFKTYWKESKGLLNELDKIYSNPRWEKEKEYPSLYGFRVYNSETGSLETDVKLPTYIESPDLGYLLPDGRIFIKYKTIDTDSRKSGQPKWVGKAEVLSPDGSKTLVRMDGLAGEIYFINNTLVAYKTNHVVSVSGNGLIKVYDINSGNLLSQIQDASSKEKKIGMNSALVYIPIKDGYVLIPYSNGLISLFSVKEMKVIASIYFTKDDWAILANDGRFDGSISALEKLEWREYNGDVLTSRTSVSSTFDGYYTPRLFNQILTGEISKAVAPVLNKQKIETLPKLTVVTIDNQSPSKSAEGIVSFTTSKKNIALEFKSTDNSKKMKEIRLYNNRKLVGVQKGNSTNAYKFNVRLNSVMGETNAIYAVATTEMGVDSEKAKIVVTYTGSDSQPPKLYALIIGVNEYQNPKYKLNYAYSDAESLLKQTVKLKSQLFQDVEVSTLFNGQANKPNILEAIKSISLKMKEQDVFLFYFAGHGTLGNMEGKEEFFLVPYDVTQIYGNEIMLNEKAISAGELKVISSQLNAQKQIFILDACNSAGALNAASTRGVAEEKAVAQLARSTGSYWLTAAGSEQYATEFDQLGHGVFTYSLLEAISGEARNLTGDGILTIKELCSFVEQRVPELSQRYKGSPQYPASFSVGNDFPLLLYTKEK